MKDHPAISLGCEPFEVSLPCGKIYLVSRSGPVPVEITRAQHKAALIRCGCKKCLDEARAAAK